MSEFFAGVGATLLVLGFIWLMARLERPITYTVYRGRDCGCREEHKVYYGDFMHDNDVFTGEGYNLVRCRRHTLEEDLKSLGVLK